ncbi:MAG TPA: phosphoadenylyl-sulfate reductase [Mycobacteriales bacterium]|nr:phosphoadenylyl-sulfate reductase [Mycobacteriales bacterium]
MSAPPGYADVAHRAAIDLEGAEPQEILAWALDAFHPRFALTTSLGDAVLIDMVSTLRAAIPVLFLDTGYHFAETMGMRAAVAARYPSRLLTITPRLTRDEQDVLYGPRLHDRDPDLCCRLRKVVPLDETLSQYVAWASGIRRDESEARRAVKVVDWDAQRDMVKVNPLAAWSQEDVDRYIAERGVLVNPLVDAGYPSIGCAPCTQAVAVGEDARAGRWAGRPKVECGLHA